MKGQFVNRNSICLSVVKFELPFVVNRHIVFIFSLVWFEFGYAL